MTKDAYSGKGMLGGYSPSSAPFPNPSGVKIFEGYGANSSDLERGYCDPDIRELPNYDLVNYEDRWTVPNSPDQDDSSGGLFGLMGGYGNKDDFEFQQKDRMSRGFCTRPKLPVDR